MKPALSDRAITALLADVMGEGPRSLERLVEGMESQAFRFETTEGLFVVRINPSLRGFEKDRWASLALAGRVPVPAVTTLGALADAAYCISEWVPGKTLEELPVSEVETLAGEVALAWRTFAASDVSSVAGFGDFDPSGKAPARTWREVLRGTLEDAEEGLPRGLSSRVSDFERMVAAYERLIDICPEERGLIHGDFGSDNLLAERSRITGVLDWDLAMVGDPLYDVANCYFWASHLTCMEVQADHFQRTLSELPDYGERLSCYTLRIGLREVLETSRDGDLGMATWALNRSRDLLLRGLSTDAP